MYLQHTCVLISDTDNALFNRILNILIFQLALKSILHKVYQLLQHQLLYCRAKEQCRSTLSPPGILEIGPELLYWPPLENPLWFVAALLNKLVPWCA